jgi:uncharacterized protein YdaU (DUF1376 family)
VNFLDHHIGDYLKLAGHLSLLEHGVYARLRDVYFATEAPIPDSKAERLVGARTPEECAAVRTVLEEFFELRDVAWHRTTFDASIAAYRAGEPEREAKKSNEAIRLKNHRDDRTRLFGLLRAAGQHADWNIKIDALRSRVAALPGQATATATPETLQATATATLATATQAPGPTTHSPRKEERPSVSSARPTLPCPYQAIVDLYHSKLPELSQVRLMSESRQRAMRKLWGWILSSTKASGERRAVDAAGALAWIGDYFDLASTNDFLMGRGERSGQHANWRADLDFLLTEKGMRHVIEKTEAAA